MKMRVEPGQINSDYGKAYLTMMNEHAGGGGIGVMTYLYEQPTYLLLRDKKWIYFITFADQAFADEWFDKHGDDYEVLWSFEPMEGNDE